MVVYLENDDDSFRGVAQAIASERGESVVTDVRDVGTGTVVVVSPPQDLSEELLLHFQRRLSENGPEEGGFTVVTGLTSDAALELYERKPSARNKHWMVLRTESKGIFSPDDDAEVVCREEATVERFEQSVDDLASLSIMTNGRSIHSFLTDGYICGIPTKIDPTLSDTRLLDCVSDGVADCPLSGDLIHADRIDVPFVFLNSCTRMVTGGYTDMATDSDFPVHVGLNLLQTASSLIGTYRPIDGLPKENALHYNLLRAGYSPLERCYLLNRNAEACDLKSYPYVHFGHPARHVSDPLEQEYDVEYTVNKRAISLTATDIESPLIDVCLPIPDDVSAPENLIVKNRTGKYEGALLNYSLFVEDDRLRLLIYSWGRLEAERLDFAIEAPNRRKKRTVSESLDNLQNLRKLNISDSKLGGQIKNLKNQFNGLANLEEDINSDTNAYRAYLSRLEMLESSLVDSKGRLLSILEERGPGFLSEDYADRVTQVDTGPLNEECYICGRPVFVKEFESPSGELARHRGICPKCINVFDVPRPDDGSVSPNYPFVRAEDEVEYGDVMTVEVGFENRSDTTKRVVYYPWLHADFEEFRGADVFEPRSAEAVLPPGERTTVEFSLDTEALPYNEKLRVANFTLYGYLLSNFEIYMGSRPLVLHSDPELPDDVAPSVIQEP